MVVMLFLSFEAGEEVNTEEEEEEEPLFASPDLPEL